MSTNNEHPESPPSSPDSPNQSQLIKNKVFLFPRRFPFLSPILYNILGFAAILFFLYDHLELRSDVKDMQKTALKAQVTLELIDRVSNDLEDTHDRIQYFRRLATYEYPRFYSVFLQFQLWSIIQRFTINCDMKSITDMRSTLRVIEEFFWGGGHESDGTTSQPNPSESKPYTHKLEYYEPDLKKEINSLANAFQLIESIICQQIEINSFSERRGKKSNRENVHIDSIRITTALEKVIANAASEVDYEAHHQLKTWIIGFTHLLLWWHSLDRTTGRLRAAYDAFTEGLDAQTSERYRLDAELRDRLSIVYWGFATLENESAYLDTAIMLLNKNIELVQAWDASVYNNLAEDQSRLLLMKLPDTSRVVGGKQKDSMMADLRGQLVEAEANIRRAVMRKLSEASYRVTLFELTCFRYAIWESLRGETDTNLTEEKLRGLLDEVFALSYVKRYHRYLFGEEQEDSEKEEPESEMMKTLKKKMPEVYKNLKDHAEKNVKIYCNWNETKVVN